eukprot:GABW01003259.1.p1 GENE.GABW01003259.1~~GABW01003259.1.p1  ORF type:complete len:72 (-),score=4.54 GABW01003259.1:166-381(-)
MKQFTPLHMKQFTPLYMKQFTHFTSLHIHFSIYYNTNQPCHSMPIHRIMIAFVSLVGHIINTLIKARVMSE